MSLEQHLLVISKDLGTAIAKAEAAHKRMDDHETRFVKSLDNNTMVLKEVKDKVESAINSVHEEIEKRDEKIAELTKWMNTSKGYFAGAMAVAGVSGAAVSFIFQVAAKFFGG